MNLNEACRMCLTSTRTIYPLFQVRMSESTVGDANAERGYVFEYLQKFASVSLKPNDGLPKQICVECLNEVSNIYTFRNRCVNAQNRMQPLIESRIPFNYEEVCRTCTNTNGPLESLQSGLAFGGKAITLLKVINKFFLLTLKINTGVPDKICHECLKRVQRAISFRKNCEKSDRTIQAIFSGTRQKRPKKSIVVKIFKKKKKNNDDGDAIVINDDDENDNDSGESIMEVINEDSILSSGLVAINLITAQANTAKSTDAREQSYAKSPPPLISLQPIVINNGTNGPMEPRENNSNSLIMLDTHGNCFVNSRPVAINLITEEQANISKSTDFREEPYSKSPPPLISLEPIVIINDHTHDAVESTGKNPNSSIMMALKEIDIVNSRSATIKLITNDQIKQISNAAETPSYQCTPEQFIIDNGDNAVGSPPASISHLEEIIIDDDSVELIEKNSNSLVMLGIKEESELEIIDVDIQNDYFNLLNAWPVEKTNLETILHENEQESSNSNTPNELVSSPDIVAPAECTPQAVENMSKTKKSRPVNQNRTEFIPIAKKHKVDLFQISQSCKAVEEDAVSSDVDFDQQIIANVIVKQV